MSSVRCPDCNEQIEVPAGTRSGDLLECPNCAGQALRVREESNRDWVATLAHRVSCPRCDQVLMLPEDVQPGDPVECCGRRYRLTLEYGAFAAEEPEEEGMRGNGLRSIGAGLTASAGAILASLCCLLPVTMIVLGLGSGAFMAVTMRYRWLLIPAGVLGVGAGVVLYVRERRRCDALGCRMAGGRLTLLLLVAAGLVVATSITLDQFPEATSDLLARLMEGPTR